MREPHPQSHVTLRYCGHVTSKKTLYLRFHKACGLHALQGSDLVWWDLTYKVTWHINHVVTWQIKNVLSSLSLGLYRPQTLQGSGSGWGDLIYKVTWHINHVVTWQIKKIYIFTFTRPMDPKLAGWWLKMRRPHPQSHVRLRYRGHMTNKKHYISPFTRLMDPTLSQFVT